MKEALAEVRSCMENPFDGFGLKPLSGSVMIHVLASDVLVPMLCVILIFT